MAHAWVEVLEGRDHEQRKALVRTLHATLVEALGIADDALTLRLIEHPSERFAVPAGHSELFTVVAVSTASAHSGVAERRLADAIARAVKACGVPTEDVSVALAEPGAEEWREIPRSEQAAAGLSMLFHQREA